MLLQLSLATAALATVRRQLSSDYYTVEEGDFCLQIISEYGNQISLETLYRNNPSINRNNCENLQIGQILYIGSGQGELKDPLPSVLLTDAIS